MLFPVKNERQNTLSGFRFPVSKILFQVSAFKNTSSGFKNTTSSFRFQKYYFQFPFKKILFTVSKILFPVSVQENTISGFKNTISGFRFPRPTTSSWSSLNFRDFCQRISRSRPRTTSSFWRPFTRCQFYKHFVKPFLLTF